jgi:hypothetical protein
MAYQPSSDVREMKLERIYQKGKAKQASQRREDEEMVVQIREWSLARGRVEKEIGRRVESATYGSSFKRN